MEEKKNRNAAKDLFCGLLLVLFGIYVIIASLNMKVYNTFIDAPGFFPTIIGAVLSRKISWLPAVCSGGST